MDPNQTPPGVAVDSAQVQDRAAAVESIDAVTARLGEKHAAGSAGQSDGGAPQVASVPPGAPVLDPAVVKQGVRSFLGIIDGAIVRKIHRTTLRLAKDEGLAKEFAHDVSMTTGIKREG